MSSDLGQPKVLEEVELFAMGLELSEELELVPLELREAELDALEHDHSAALVADCQLVSVLVKAQTGDYVVVLDLPRVGAAQDLVELPLRAHVAETQH